MQSEKSESKPLKYFDSSWDFRGEDTKYSNHGFHTYPAMMIPQVARRLIETYGKDSKVMLDPFMGSGTSILEASLHNNFQRAYGIDINPLALLIAKVKTTNLPEESLKQETDKLLGRCSYSLDHLNFSHEGIDVPRFNNIDFWFKPKVVRDLTVIKNEIEEVKDKDIKDFFYVAFSETVRTVSNTRNGEYKLYRIDKDRLIKHDPNTLQTFSSKLRKNVERMIEYSKVANQNIDIRLLAEDTRKRTSIGNEEVDLVVTSPPYGDSHTTVAYGQFSRLSLQWLGYDYSMVKDIDRQSLGGISSRSLENVLPSPSLQSILYNISSQDEVRAREVLSFYLDFNKCIKEIDRVTKAGSHLCFVVGNRTVKGVKIPTDQIIVELFQMQGKYSHLNTFIRNIPNKRMPSKNSPTNIKGNHAVTMNEEWIVVMKKL